MTENTVDNLYSEQDNDLCRVAFHSQLTLQLRTPDAIKHVQNRSLITALNKEEFKYRIISQNRWNPKYLGCELCVHWQ